MTYYNLADDKKFGFNLNTPESSVVYPEVIYQTTEGGKRTFTHIVSGRLIKQGLSADFSAAGYTYTPVYHTTPVYIDKVIKGNRKKGTNDRIIQTVNPKYMDVVSYHFPDKFPREVSSFVGRVKA